MSSRINSQTAVQTRGRLASMFFFLVSYRAVLRFVTRRVVSCLTVLLSLLLLCRFVSFRFFSFLFSSSDVVPYRSLSRSPAHRSSMSSSFVDVQVAIALQHIQASANTYAYDSTALAAIPLPAAAAAFPRFGDGDADNQATER